MRDYGEVCVDVYGIRVNILCVVGRRMICRIIFCIKVLRLVVVCKVTLDGGICSVYVCTLCYIV